MSEGRGPFLSAVTAVSLAGVVLGVAALLVIFSIVTGFEEVFREKLMGVYPHAVVMGPGGDVREWREVEQAVPAAGNIARVAAATYDEMMIARAGRRQGVLLKGIKSAASPGARLLATAPGGAGASGLFSGLDFKADAKQLELSVSSGTAGLGWVGFVLDRGFSLLEPSVETAPEGKASIRFAAPGPSRATVTAMFEDPGELRFGPAGSDWLTVEPGRLVVNHNGVEHLLALEAGCAYTAFFGGKGKPLLLQETSEGGAPGGFLLANIGASAWRLRVGDELQEVPPGGSARTERFERRMPGILLGSELAKTLEAKPGDRVTLVSPLRGAERFLGQTPSFRPASGTFQVLGTVDLGFFEYDSKLAVVDFFSAMSFLGRGDRARWVEVETADFKALPGTISDLRRVLSGASLTGLHQSALALDRRLAALLADNPAPAAATAIDQVAWLRDLAESMRFGPEGSVNLGIGSRYRIISWKEMNRSMFSAMQKQRLVLSLFFLIMIMVAAFNIVGSQLMMVREKQAQMALLKVMGLTSGDVANIFTWYGLVLGGAGALLGLCFGGAICWALERFGFPLDPVVYYVSELPIRLLWRDFLFVTLSAALLVFVTVRVSAKRVSRMAPVDGLNQLE